MTSGGHVAEARIGLSPASRGRPACANAAEKPSLLLRFPSLDSPGEQTTIGAATETLDGAPLEPGTGGLTVRLMFWADKAQLYATPGAKFSLWYAGRTVGQGEVLRITGEAADSIP